MLVARCSRCGHEHVGADCWCGCKDWSALAEDEGAPPPSREPLPAGQAGVTDAESRMSALDADALGSAMMIHADKAHHRYGPVLACCAGAAYEAGRARYQERIANAERLLGLEVLAREAAQKRIRELEAFVSYFVTRQCERPASEDVCGRLRLSMSDRCLPCKARALLGEALDGS